MVVSLRPSFQQPPLYIICLRYILLTLYARANAAIHKLGAHGRHNKNVNDTALCTLEVVVVVGGGQAKKEKYTHFEVLEKHAQEELDGVDVVEEWNGGEKKRRKRETKGEPFPTFIKSAVPVVIKKDMVLLFSLLLLFFPFLLLPLDVAAEAEERRRKVNAKVEDAHDRKRERETL